MRNSIFFKKLFSSLPKPILSSIISSYITIKRPYNKHKEQKRFIFDENGIPSIDYGKIDDIKIGIQKNPVTISQQTMTYFNQLQKKPTNQIKEKLLNCANWLVTNSVRVKNYSLLYYNFSWPTYNLEKKWVSAMAQGLAIQALIYAHKIVQDKKYINTAKLFLNSFYVETKDGGVTYKDTSDRWWYEEYASKLGKQPRVLNGMIFALFGINDYNCYQKDPDAEFLFQQGIKALKNDLPRYDYGKGYSYYDVLQRPAGKYHKIHVEQLEQLFKITGEKIFKTYFENWKNFNYNKNIPELIIDDILGSKNSKKF